MKKLNEIIRNLIIESRHGNLNIEISSIQYDSRKCDNGALFVAIRGTLTDGHFYIKKAIEKGATAVVCEEIPLSLAGKQDITLIKVNNSRKALALLSDEWYDRPSHEIKVIGVTGTNGKTTISFILADLLAYAGKKVGIIGTTGIYIGKEKLPATHTTPESLELCKLLDMMKKKDVSHVILEVSSHALKQYRVDSIRFAGAVFTNLTHDHLDYHSTFKDYALSKKRLFDMLPKDSYAIVNHDDRNSEYMLENCLAGMKISYGRSQKAGVAILNEKPGVEYTEFETLINSNSTDHKGMKLQIKTKLNGRFNIDNVCACVSVAIAERIEPKIISEALLITDGAPGRLQKVTLNSGAIAFVDYAHTPDALEKALLACRDMISSSNGIMTRLICVFGCGGDRDRSKRSLMGSISVKIADLTIITSDNPRNENPELIIDEIYEGINKEYIEKTIRISDRAQAIEYAVKNSAKEDLILVAGKGHEDYQIIGNNKKYFDDVVELSKLNN